MRQETAWGSTALKDDRGSSGRQLPTLSRRTVRQALLRLRLIVRDCNSRCFRGSWEVCALSGTTHDWVVLPDNRGQSDPGTVQRRLPGPDDEQDEGRASGRGAP